MSIARVGFVSALAAAAATLLYDVVQIAQVAGLLRFPVDEVLIYGAALCIAVPFLLAMLALHHLTDRARQYWTHAALLFTVIYAVFVIANYVVQLATVIPAKLRGEGAAVALLDQTPHSMFWDFDAIGYIAMAIAMLLAMPALGGNPAARRTRVAFAANVAVTPLIAVVYFAPGYSPQMLWIGFPWAVTAPLAMVMLGLALRSPGPAIR